MPNENPQSGPVEFDAANRWLRNRTSLPTMLSSAELAVAPDFPAQVRAHAFFSARVSTAGTLQALRRQVDSYAAGDIGATEARLRIKTFLSRQGWPVDDVSDADTPPAGMDEEAWGEAKKITNLGSTRRLDLILRTNSRMAAAVGQREVSMHPAVMDRWPHFQYFSRRDGRERRSHYELHGTILPKDDPFWRTHTPPWDFGCRCWIEDADSDDGEPDQVVQRGESTYQVRTSQGRVVTIDPNESGFEFDAAAPFEQPDWDAIEDGPLKQIVREDYSNLYGDAA